MPTFSQFPSGRWRLQVLRGGALSAIAFRDFVGAIDSQEKPRRRISVRAPNRLSQ
jgi:hypothetical protein